MPIESSEPRQRPHLTVVASSDDPQRQRAMRVDVKISQQAMKVVLPTNKQIGPWQARAAHLLALTEKLKATGRHDPAIAREAEALRDTIERYRRSLDDRVQGLPSDVAASTRLEDTARALTSVASVLDRTLALMKPNEKP